MLRHAPIGLFYKALAHAVDEICIGRDQACGSHFRGDLAAMVCRMHDHVGQNVFFAATPFFSLAVAIADGFSQRGLSARFQKNSSTIATYRPPALRIPPH